MSQHKTLPVNPETKEKFEEDKPDGVTWDHYINNLYRNAKAYERGENE